MASPRLSGGATLSGGSFSDALQGVKLTGLEARVAANGPDLVIERFAAQTPGGGTLSARGNVKLDPAAGFPGTIRIEYQNFPLFTDRDAFLKVYQELACREGVYDIHHASNGEIALTGPDTATGKWSLNFRTIVLATRSVTRLAVEYEDVYRKQDGRWYIAETRTVVTSMFTEVVGEDGSPKYAVLGEAPAGVPEPA